jgi:hypothetical protein
MTWESVLAEALGAFHAGQVTFSVGNFRVAITGAHGAPVRFTLAAAIQVAEEVWLERTGEVQVGSVLITIVDGPPGVSYSTPLSATLAAAIAPTTTPSAAPVTAIAPSSLRGRVTTEPAGATP